MQISQPLRALKLFRQMRAYDVLVVAEPMPETVSAAGTVSIWAKNTPSANIPVTINITEIV